jgi:choline dehydrogenase
VLDGKLRVRGTRNVRVVDASSFPRIPGILPWAPIAILSEKASHDVLIDAS